MEKIGQDVYEVNINKVINAKSDLYKDGISIEKHKIIGISKHKICINNDFFSTFSFVDKGKRKDNYSYYLNDINVRIKTKEDYFGNGVFITMYSTKKPNKKLLEKMVATASLKIDKEYGFLFNGAKDELYNMVDDWKN